MARKGNLIVSIIILLVLSILESKSQNLLSNGGFEVGQSDWSGWGTNLVISEVNPQEGINSARFTGSNTLEQTGIAVTPGQEYKLSFWVRINSMTGNDWGGIRIAAIEWNWSQTYASEFYTTSNRPLNQWFNEIITFTPATNQIRVQAQFFAGGGWTSYDFQVDNLNLYVNIPVNQPPVIQSFTVSPASGTVPFTVTGTVVASDPDGAIQNYVFDMGDGAVYTDASSFSHTYRIQGNYTLRVTLVDDEGATTMDTRLITASGNNSHTIEITSPAGGIFFTNQNQITLEGTRSNGAGNVFWINNRTGQSGFVSVTGNQFTIKNMGLHVGNNLIHVQSSNGTGNFVSAQVMVQYNPAGYNGPVISNIAATKTTLEQYERTNVNFDLATTADNLSFPFDETIPQNLNTGSGITVDMIFTNGAITLRQPAFLDMDYMRNGNLLVP